jgi:hypothetical protein
MKAFKFAISFVMVIGMIIGVSTLNAWASDYLGELCWHVEKEGELIIVKLGVTHLGGGHYHLSGKTFEDGNLRHIVNGNAEIEGNNVLITLTGSDKDALEMNSFSSHGILDISTLNGTWDMLNHEVEFPGLEIKTDYENYSLTFIPCPK